MMTNEPVGEYPLIRLLLIYCKYGRLLFGRVWAVRGRPWPDPGPVFFRPQRAEPFLHPHQPEPDSERPTKRTRTTDLGRTGHAALRVGSVRTVQDPYADVNMLAN
jgi:hypothetical protein